MIRSPSKFLSIDFLRKLKKENYLSEGGKEYCSDEVDQLLTEKLCAQAIQQEQEFMIELSQRAEEAQMMEEIMKQQEEEMRKRAAPTEAKILSIVPKITEQKEAQKVLDRLKCIECGHSVADESEWLFALDDKESMDSGSYQCPNCNALQDHGVFDGMVQVTQGDFPMLQASIPMDMIDEIVDDVIDGAEGFKFNIGTAILNAVKEQIVERYGENCAGLFTSTDTDSFERMIDRIKLRRKQKKGNKNG